ncbi:mate efflux family subfamily [Fusarium longipes]|uniref:Mate efflux family subfamily n=1 Tax=Fusarium longipes TaxID=694270 RepID=A0A395RJ18_9HYPO|nr:mate efflux family subfamily [Fusarium longipes]
MRQQHEREPLLGRRSRRASTSKSKSPAIIGESIRLLQATIPITASFALQNIVQAVSVITVGSLGHHQLDIASYGFMFATCTGSMVAIGGSTALDTLCGHAVASCKTSQTPPSVLGRYLQQTIFVLSVLFIGVITPIWIFSHHLFLALGQDAWLAHGTHRFLVLTLPAGYCQMLAECLKKYGQVQGDSSAVGWATFAATVVGVVSNLVLVKKTALGIDGAPVAFFVYQFTTVVILVALIARRERLLKTIEPVRTWGAFRDGMGTNAFLALTGLATIATEWWSFEILAIMAARLSASEIAAQSILMSVDLIFTTVSLGIGVASSHRIGYFFGRNEPQSARRAAFSPYLLSLLVGAIEFVAIMSTRHRFGYLFTSDPESVAMTAKVLPWMAMFQILDLSNGGAGGILRGAKKNHLSGVCNFVAYYGVGLTTAWVLCFRWQWGVVGLWAGIVCGSGGLIILQTCCVVTLPWKKIALDASGDIDTGSVASDSSM